jgi:hypothetical protein
MREMRNTIVLTVAAVMLSASAEAELVRLRVERRETVLGGRAFGLAGPYEKIVGVAEFALDPALPQNQIVVDLPLAPRNARGRVEFTADFYLLKPVDPAKGNGRLFYEVGNRGGKAMLPTFHKATGAPDPSTDAEFGDGTLMRQGFTLLWMGWQWDVPDGRMRMEMPVATADGKPITGLVRGNFILNRRADTASVADRNHKAYPVLKPTAGDDQLTVRSNRTDKPAIIPRSKWKWVDPQTVAVDGGFEPGKIYDVVYRAQDPKVVGVGLAGTRDIVSFFKYEKSEANPVPTIRYALAWGVSQSGRFLRHFLYQGFNEDERGRQVFDGVIDQVGGAGRGSFNHRFAQASRDALEHFNILFPVDLFPFTDSPSTDPETRITDSLLARAEKSGTVPKLFHLLTNSEYFNRNGSLIHTDPSGSTDAELPSTSRIYLMSSAPHGPGPFPPTSNAQGDLIGLAALNPLDYRPVVRALFAALDRWVAAGVEPPPSRYARIADGTLVLRSSGGWPAIPGFAFPPPQLVAYRLDFGPQWSKGIVDFEPPKIGKPYVVRVPAVDADGNDRAGVRLPEVAVPLATHAGWNLRHPSIGAPEHLAGEIGSYIPFPRTRAERQRTGDPRRSIEERYASKEIYLQQVTAASLVLMESGLLLSQDLAGIRERASAHWDFAISPASSASATRDPRLHTTLRPSAR